MTKKGHQVLRMTTEIVITFWGKKGWHHQLPHRVTPVLVMPLVREGTT